MRKTTGRKLVLCCLLLCVNLAFIWGNSILPRNISSQISSSVLGVIEKILSHPLFEKVSVKLINFFNELLGTSIPNQNVGHHLLRKMGHFTEFCWLGLTLTWMFLILEQKGIHQFTMPLVFGMLAACIDETIQLYSDGRASSLVDVWIDTAGVCTGIILLLLGHALLTMSKHKKQQVHLEETKI